MSPQSADRSLERVTLDDIRHKAEAVKRQAVDEAKGAADSIARSPETQTLAIVAGLVVAAASLAFFLGSRSGRAVVARQMLDE